jgi:hypothetical protein
MKGRENNQNRKNETKCTVVVPEFGIPFLIPPVASAWGRQFISASNSQLTTHITPAVPDSTDHKIHAVAPDPRLYAIPYASHRGAVEHGPQGTPNSERRTVDDWKRDMVCCSNPTC